MAYGELLRRVHDRADRRLGVDLPQLLAEHGRRVDGQDALAEARRRGHDALGIMAIHGNDRAHRLYERHFDRWATFHEAAFDGRFPGVTRYRSTIRR